eukprot:s3298_g7.t1
MAPQSFYIHQHSNRLMHKWQRGFCGQKEGIQVCQFASDLPWVPDRAFEDGGQYKGPRPVQDEVTVIYLVSSFGFSGSPGEWTAWGRATEEFHRAHRPRQSRRDGSSGFDSKVLVDDCVLVEPWVGLRPWVSAEVFEDGVVKMLGQKAVNQEKDAIEGAFKRSQTIWGVIMDTEEEKAFLPEKRIQKGAVLMSGPEFDFGNQTLTLRQLQQFRGILTGWAAVVRGLENELKAADHFLGGLDGQAVIKPRLRGEGSPEWETARRWEDLWELFEVCRWLSAQTDRWEGEWEAAAWVSSDATPTMVGAIDWTNKTVFRMDTKLLKTWAQKALTDEEVEDEAEELAIHLGEMMSIVAFACRMSEKWANHVVIYGGDNTVVRSWIQTRRSKTRGGRILIRVLNMAEMRSGFTLLAGWWRTYHNIDADMITRCSEDEYQQFIKDKQFSEVKVGDEVRQALVDTERFGPCFLYFEDEADRQSLLQIKDRRAKRQLLKEVSVPWPKIRVLEWSSSNRRLKDFLTEAKTLGAGVESSSFGPTILCASLGADCQGRALGKVLEFSQREEVWIGLIEGPRIVPWELGERRCQREGWGYGLVEYVTTEHGEALARRRQCLVFDRGGQLPDDWASTLVRMGAPTSMASLLKPLASDDAKWVKPHRLEVESGIPRERMLPQPAGHVWWTEAGDREVIYDLGGPGRWPLFDEQQRQMEDSYVFDRRGPGGHVRKLEAEEVWKLQGRSAEDLKRLGMTAEEAVVEGTRATGRHTAANLLVLAGHLIVNRMEEAVLSVARAGMCPDEVGADALAQMLVWFRKWKRGDLQRAVPFYASMETRAGGARQEDRHVWRWPEAWWWSVFADEEDSGEDYELPRKAGAKRKKTPEEVAETVGSQVVGQLGLAIAPFQGEVKDRVEEWLEENLAGDKSQATEKAYMSAWQKWCAWARRQEWTSEYLNRQEDPVEQENKVLAYVGYLGWLGASPNTIRQHLFAIKSAHKRTGRGDPTEKMYRIWILVNALDRRNTSRRPRRLGVTPEMLEWLGAQLIDPLENEAGNSTWADSTMIMAALELAWFYMLRAKEFADSNGVDEEMIVRGCDVRLALCPVEAMDRMRKSWPLRFEEGHSESVKPLFRWASGRVLKRIEVQHLLQRAAGGVGLPPGRFLSHSLRIGGATALFQSTADIEIVKRAGRWTSSAVQRYLTDGGAVSGISRKMAATDPKPHYT